MMRRWFVIVTLLTIFFQVQPVQALNHQQYAVEDRSGVLSTETKQQVTDYAFALQQKTGAEFAVIIQPNTGDELVVDYAHNTFQQMALGQKGEENGVLFVMTTEENPNTGEAKQLRFEVGYGLEGALPDGKVGRMLDEIAIPYLQQGDIDAAILQLYKAVYNEIMIEYGLDGEQVLVDTLNGEYDSQSSDEGISIWVLIVIIIVVLLLSSGGNKGGKGPRGRSGGGGPPIFFPTGFGGGSGGSSGGGGFGGFGGGGSSGGGGAGRSW